MKNYIFTFLLPIVFLLLPFFVAAQPEIPVTEMTREEVLALDYDDLIDMELDQLMQLAEVVGMSVEELLLNASVSTASKEEESLFFSPLSTTVLQREEIEASGATNIPEALRMVPGVIVRQKTNGNYDVHIRGLEYIPPGEMIAYTENTVTLVMIDNRPIRNFFQGGIFWETLPVTINDVERIEIIRGASSALYGPDAVTGVIHIITKSPENNRLHVEGGGFRGKASGGGSANGSTTGGYINVSLGIKKLQMRAAFNYDVRDRFQNTYYNFYADEYQTGEDFVNYLNSFNTSETSHEYDKFFPDFNKSFTRNANNYFFDYKPNDKLDFHLDFGIQNSSVQTTYIEVGSFLNYRESETSYFDFKANVYGFETQLSGVTGTFDAIRGLNGFKYDMGELSGNIGYRYKYKSLTIRPGMAFNAAAYNDSAYIFDNTSTGFLNGSRELATVEGNLRIDYTIRERLRLIAAISGGHYYKPEKDYFAYQFIGSFKIDENNVIRAVVSQANVSPSMVGVYANYSQYFANGEESEIIPGRIAKTYGVYQYLGNDSADLPQLNMIELGFRNKLTTRIQTDFEFFYSITKNHGGLVQLASSVTYVPGLEYDSVFIYEAEKFENLDIISHQFGASGSIIAVLGEKFQIRTFATLQSTYINNFNVEDSITLNSITGETVNNEWFSENSMMLNMKHTYTPAFYGGTTINYSLSERLNINFSTYYYSKQRFQYYERNLEPIVIPAKFVANLMVSWRFFKKSEIYFDARNLFNNTSKEFAYSDDVKGLYLIGINLRF